MKHVRTSRTFELSVSLRMSTKERVRLWDRFISFMSDRGDQPGPPSLKEGRHEQRPVASTSYRTMGEKDTLVGDVSMMCEGGVNPIEGDGQDDAITPLNERRPWAVWQFFIDE